MNEYITCVFKNDEDFTITQANKAFYETLGHDEVEIQYKYGNRLCALLSTETIYKFRELIKQKNPAAPNVFEHSIRNNHDKKIWLHSELTISDSDASPSLISMVSYDVTHFLEAEHMLSVTQKELSSLCHLSDLAFIDCSADDRRIYFADTSQFFGDNFAVDDIFPDILIKRGSIHPDYIEKLRAVCSQLEVQTTGILCELKTKNKSNDFRWTTLSLTKSSTDGQEHIYAVFSDSSSEKEATTKYLNETLFYQTLLNVLPAYAHVDVTEDKVLRVGGIWMAYTDIIDKITYSELIVGMIHKLVHIDDKKQYLDTAVPASFIKARHSGVSTLSCNFRRILEQNQMTWMRFTANIFEHPVTHHVMALLYLSRVEESTPALSGASSVPDTKEDCGSHTDNFDKQFDSFLGENGEIAYVVNPKNYELLCGNQAFYKRIGMTKEECSGCKCYEIIHRRNFPCTFCANANWSADHFYMYRNYNEFLNQDFLIKNKLIYWNGMQALFAMAIDLSNNKTVLDLIDNGITEDRVIVSGIQNMHDSENLRGAVYAALEAIGKFYGAKGVKFWRLTDSSNKYTPDFVYLSKSQGGSSLPPDIPDECDAVDKWLHMREWEGSLTISNPQEMLSHSYELYHRMERQHMNNEIWFLLKNIHGGELGIIEVTDITINYQNNNFMNSFMGFISTEWDNRELVEKIVHSNYHDSMTNLLNRAHFEKYMEEFAEDKVDSVGMIICNIDGLKKINDSLGFHKGNEYIRKLGETLKTKFEGSMIYRLNSDEFLTIFTDISRKEMEENLYSLQEDLVDLKQFTVSIGYSYDSVEKDLESLFQFAFQSMKLDKMRYYRSTDTDNKERVELLSWVTEALNNGNMVMFLQPKVDVRTDIAVGAEALIRCKDAEGNVIPLSKFIPPLEKQNLIRYVDLFIFEETCRLLEKWKRNNTRLIKISLNFSRLTLTEHDLTSSLEAIISRYDVDKKYIEIEITESFDGAEKELLYHCAKQIHTAGYSISLDDFGTKYTNLSALAYFSADVLKIDRSLVYSVETDYKTRVILKNIILMCRELGMEMIAEGVENIRQAKIMKSLGCYIVQGFLYSRPIPVEKFEQLFMQ